jgi:hypothetical protein
VLPATGVPPVVFVPPLAPPLLATPPDAIVPPLVPAPPDVVVLSVAAVPPLAPPLVTTPPDVTGPPVLVKPPPDDPPAVDVPPVATGEPPIAAPPVPVTPPEPGAPALEPEPPVDESQPSSKIMAPASSGLAQAFRNLVGIASSLKSILRIIAGTPSRRWCSERGSTKRLTILTQWSRLTSQTAVAGREHDFDVHVVTVASLM